MLLALAFLTGCGVSSLDDGGLSASSAAVTSHARVGAGGDRLAVAPVRNDLETSAAAKALSDRGVSDSYKIGPFDVVEVTVFKVPELSKVVQISEAGTVNYPLLGEVPAIGRTPRELEVSLAKALAAKYLQNPQVSVYVKEYNSQRVTMEGEVKKPGIYPMQGGATLLQAIALAGGVDAASDNTVLILRSDRGRRSAAKFELDDIRAGKSEDPKLRPGDVVVAGKSAIKEGFGTILKALPLASVFALL